MVRLTQIAHRIRPINPSWGHSISIDLENISICITGATYNS
jgi:hypothetical protein